MQLCIRYFRLGCSILLTEHFKIDNVVLNGVIAVIQIPVLFILEDHISFILRCMYFIEYQIQW